MGILRVYDPLIKNKRKCTLTYIHHHIDLFLYNRKISVFLTTSLQEVCQKCAFVVKTLGLTNQCCILFVFFLPCTRAATKDVFGRNFVVFWLYLVEGEGGIARARGWVTGERRSVAGRYTQRLWHCTSQLNKIQNTIYKIQNTSQAHRVLVTLH